MPSTNSTKPEFTEGFFWGPVIFWAVATVAAIVAIPFLFIFGALKGIFGKNGYTSHSYAPTNEEEGDDAFGYKPGSPYYSKPGAINPVLLDFWESHKN